MQFLNFSNMHVQVYVVFPHLQIASIMTIVCNELYAFGQK